MWGLRHFGIPLLFPPGQTTTCVLTQRQQTTQVCSPYVDSTSLRTLHFQSECWNGIIMINSTPTHRLKSSRQTVDPHGRPDSDFNTRRQNIPVSNGSEPSVSQERFMTARVKSALATAVSDPTKSSSFCLDLLSIETCLKAQSFPNLHR